MKSDSAESDSESTSPFSDVASSDWYKDAVDFVYDNNLMTGINQSTFAPDKNTSRAMLITILWRQAGCPVVETEANFADILPEAYYSQALRWAVKEGIVPQTGNTMFGPDEQITREELATMLYRFAQVSGYDVSKQADLSQYTDASEISQSNIQAIKWVVRARLDNRYERYQSVSSKQCNSCSNCNDYDEIVSALICSKEYHIYSDTV